MLLMYNYVLLKMSTWYSKHVEESNNIWRINNTQCITLVVLYGGILCFLNLSLDNFMLRDRWLNWERKDSMCIIMLRVFLAERKSNWWITYQDIRNPCLGHLSVSPVNFRPSEPVCLVRLIFKKNYRIKKSVITSLLENSPHSPNWRFITFFFLNGLILHI